MLVNIEGTNIIETRKNSNGKIFPDAFTIIAEKTNYVFYGTEIKGGLSKLFYKFFGMLGFTDAIHVNGRVFKSLSGAAEIIAEKIKNLPKETLQKQKV